MTETLMAFTMLTIAFTLAIPLGIYLSLPFVRKLRVVKYKKSEGISTYVLILKEDKDVPNPTLSRGGKEL